METQWRWAGGMASQRVGLDYGALRNSYDMVGVRKKDRKAVFSGLQTMERAALNAWNEQRKRP